jgi:hypothetical protein
MIENKIRFPALKSRILSKRARENCAQVEGWLIHNDDSYGGILYDLL